MFIDDLLARRRSLLDGRTLQRNQQCLSVAATEVELGRGLFPNEFNFFNQPVAK